MKVIVKGNISGNAGLYRKGREYDLTKSEGEFMVKEGYAVPVKDKEGFGKIKEHNKEFKPRTETPKAETISEIKPRPKSRRGRPKKIK